MENDKNQTIKLFDGASPVIFKLRKNWNGDGRKVKYVSDGYYVVFAPRDWQRTGEAPIDPLECVDKGFLAHYFFSDGKKQQGGFVGHSPIFEQKRFSLEGETVTDDSDYGDFYVGTPPKLISTDNWRDISWIRAGKEDDGSWNENFDADEKNFTEFLGNREGWFYVRIYDENVKLMHGMDFRYLLNFEGILVNGKPYSTKNIIVPGAGGHTKTTIQFTGNIKVKSDDPDIAIDDNNTAVVAPTPEHDNTHWTLIGDNGRVKAGVYLPRVWWCLINTPKEPREWRDTAFQMSRDEFRKNRSATIIIRLPPVVKKICAGFDSFKPHDGAHKYLAKYDANKNIKQAEFELRDFCNHAEISEHSHKESILQIQIGEACFSLIHIPADDPLPNRTPVSTLSKGPRFSVKNLFCPVTGNKGFSHGELDATGLTTDKAKQLGIRFDRRRKTTHHSNIDALLKLPEEHHAN